MVKDFEPLPRGKEQILLVDDEEPIIDAIQKMLHHLGYRVQAMTSSLEALETFREQPHSFDLVITDQTMPLMSGSELAKAILLIRPDIPIIICTGYSENINEEKAINMGINEFIMKPLAIQELAIKVREVLDS